MQSRSLLVLIVISLIYIAAGVVHSLTAGNNEFVLYSLMMIPVLGVGYYVFYLLKLPFYLSVLLMILGALHLAGGILTVNGDVLYNYVLIPIDNWSGLTIWKFDQLVHPYGALVVALAVFAALRRWTSMPALGIMVLAFLAANGAGALNEVAEFATKITLPDTNVGGYYNSSLDLFFNMIGAVLGSLLGFATARHSRQHTTTG